MRILPLSIRAKFVQRSGQVPVNVPLDHFYFAKELMTNDKSLGRMLAICKRRKAEVVSSKVFLVPRATYIPGVHYVIS